jgi:hypothetical protein
MKDDGIPWRPQDEEGADDEDIDFLVKLHGDQIAFSKRAWRKIGGKADTLTRTIAQRARLLESRSGEVRSNGHSFIYELIRTELTWTENPMAPYDKFNFKREVSVCTRKEGDPSDLKRVKPSKRKRKK